MPLSRFPILPAVTRKPEVHLTDAHRLEAQAVAFDDQTARSASGPPQTHRDTTARRP